MVSVSYQNEVNKCNHYQQLSFHHFFCLFLSCLDHHLFWFLKTFRFCHVESSGVRSQRVWKWLLYCTVCTVKMASKGFLFILWQEYQVINISLCIFIRQVISCQRIWYCRDGLNFLIVLDRSETDLVSELLRWGITQWNHPPKMHWQLPELCMPLGNCWY